MIDTPQCSLNFIPLSSLPNCSLFEISTLKLFGSQLAIFPFQSTKPSLAFYRPTYYQAFSQQPQKLCCLNGRISTKDTSISDGFFPSTNCAAILKLVNIIRTAIISA